MKRSTEIKLRKLVERIIKEEEAKVTAKPVVKKGEMVKVYSGYSGKYVNVTAISSAEYDDDIETYSFEGIGANGEDYYVVWAGDRWALDPSYHA